jgi:hypothetical protein
MNSVDLARFRGVNKHVSKTIPRKAQISIVRYRSSRSDEEIIPLLDESIYCGTTRVMSVDVKCRWTD